MKLSSFKGKHSVASKLVFFLIALVLFSEKVEAYKPHFSKIKLGLTLEGPPTLHLKKLVVFKLNVRNLGRDPIILSKNPLFTWIYASDEQGAHKNTFLGGEPDFAAERIEDYVIVKPGETLQIFKALDLEKLPSKSSHLKFVAGIGPTTVSLFDQDLLKKYKALSHNGKIKKVETLFKQEQKYDPLCVP